MKTIGRTSVCAVSALSVFLVPAYGISGTTLVAVEGVPVSAEQAERYGWPAGAFDLLNDPLRSTGWNPWFSECSNDINHYAINLRNREDLDGILQKLDALQCDVVRVQLTPEKEHRRLGLPEGNDIAAVFALGSQNLVIRWYERLEELGSGVRKFGVHRYEVCPEAMPPTLTLYMGSAVIDLDELHVPERVEVPSGVTDSFRKNYPENPLIDAIDRFVVDHQVGEEKPVIDSLTE